MSNAARKVEGHSHGKAMSGPRSDKLAAQMEPFDSFWEGPEDVEKGYRTFKAFYRANYLKHVTPNKDAKILVISCGPGYFVNVLNQAGYFDVTGIDSYEDKVEQGKFHGLNCVHARAFEYLAEQDDESFDVIFGEQELNHLTKDEMIEFSVASPSEAEAGRPAHLPRPEWRQSDRRRRDACSELGPPEHFHQLLAQPGPGAHWLRGAKNLRAAPLRLLQEPRELCRLGADRKLHFLFQVLFKIYGKFNKIFEKKIAAVAIKPYADDTPPGKHLRSV